MPDADRDALIIFARLPVPGRAKTRLGRTLGMEEAARFYGEMAEHAFRIGDEELARGTEVHLRYTAPAPEEELRRWVGRSFRYAEQVGETLGDRMRRAFEDLFAAGCARAVIIGTDVPELEPADVRSAFDRLEDADLVVGPSTDGGYYLLGMRRLHTELFEGIAWSSDSVCAETLRRAEAAGLRCALLDPLSDIDSMEDYLAYRLRRGLREA